MIKLNIKITWPAALLVLAAVLVWLSRQGAPMQPQPVTKRDPNTRTARPTRREEPAEPIVIDHHHGQRVTTSSGTPDPSRVSYAEAIRAPMGTYTEDEINAIADRELREAAADGFNSMPHDNPLKAHRPAWRRT